MGDATSLASMDSIENLTELDDIKKALERLSKQEVSEDFVFVLLHSFYA
jgi:hypothetical protein